MTVNPFGGPDQSIWLIIYAICIIYNPNKLDLAFKLQ